MKKKYIEPVVFVISMHDCQLLTSSDEEIEMNIFTDKEEATEAALSNRRNIWDDDDF